MTGVLDLSAHDYHADNIADVPTLSASIAKLLISKSPAHAFVEHPKLNPAYKRDDDPKYDLGIACHALMLEGRNAVEICDFPNWATNAAKDAKKNARQQGRIPLLGKEWDAVVAMRDAARDQLARHEAVPPLFEAGRAEQTLTWEEDGVACRARLDWLHDDLSYIDDLKSTGRSAKASSWTRSSLFANGYDLQAAWYLRGLKAVTGAEARWRWCVVETSPPYAVEVIEPSEETLEIGAAKCEMALALWLDCMASGDWPAYGPGVKTAEALPWETRWLITDELEEAAWAQM